MAKDSKKASDKKAAPKKTDTKKAAAKKTAAKKAGGKKRAAKRAVPPPFPLAPVLPAGLRPPGASANVLDRLWRVIESRRTADPEVSHSARLLQRGTAKVAQKFGEEAVECLIEATRGNPEGLVAESADVLYHLLVMWVDAGIRPDDVWAELHRREGVSGIAEKAARAKALPARLGLATRKIP
jgi:phosphoribosyl-ATP pyrophosphohydrolase